MTTDDRTPTDPPAGAQDPDLDEAARIEAFRAELEARRQAAPDVEPTGQEPRLDTAEDGIPVVELDLEGRTYVPGMALAAHLEDPLPELLGLERRDPADRQVALLATGTDEEVLDAAIEIAQRRAAGDPAPAWAAANVDAELERRHLGILWPPGLRPA